MSFTDNSYIVKGSYLNGTLASTNVGRAHFVRIVSTVANTTVTLQSSIGATLGTVLIGNAGDSIVIEKKPAELLTTDQSVYATGEGDGSGVEGIGTIITSVSDAGTTLQSWFDGSDSTKFIPSGPADGDTFTQWTDKSNFAHNANPTGGATTRPTFRTNVLNTRSIVRFDGTNDCLSINPVAWAQSLSGMTILVVAKYTSTSGARTLTVTDQSDMGIFIDTNYKVSMNGATADTSTAADTSFHIHTLVFDGTQSTDATKLVYRIDGSAETLTFTGSVGSTTSASNGTIFLGCDDSTQYLNGDVAEFLMFNKALNASEITSVESYLTTKWGL